MYLFIHHAPRIKQCLNPVNLNMECNAYYMGTYCPCARPVSIPCLPINIPFITKAAAIQIRGPRSVPPVLSGVALKNENAGSSNGRHRNKLKPGGRYLRVRLINGSVNWCVISQGNPMSVRIGYTFITSRVTNSHNDTRRTGRTNPTAITAQTCPSKKNLAESAGRKNELKSDARALCSVISNAKITVGNRTGMEKVPGSTGTKFPSSSCRSCVLNKILGE